MKKICVKTTKLKIIVTTLLILSLMLVSIYVKASSVSVTPSEDQYFELRAKNVNAIEGKDKQVIFELWGHNIEFKGYDVRFTYDTDNFATSSLTTNEYTTDETEFFKFESEFSNCLDFFTIPYDGTSSGGVRAIISFDPPVTESEHIKEKDEIGMVVDTTGDVLLGKMSFRMKLDQFDISSFKLEASDSSSPKTGIKINIDGGTTHYEDQSTFRFTDRTASQNADLSNLIISTGNKEESTTYKEYSYTPNFEKDTLNYELELMEYIDNMDITAVLSDSKSNMKLKIPKRDENNELVYDSDGTTITYEEKEIEDNTATEITLNKLGEPDTKVTVIVTAEDGETIKEYTITIKRPYGTIKGSIQLGNGLRESMQNSYGVYTKYLADATVYKSNSFNWDGLVDKETTYDELDVLDIEQRVSTNEDDGSYEIKIIPGNYDLQLERKGFLNVVIKNIDIANNEVINLGNKILIPGDVDRDGIIGLTDYSKLMNRKDATKTDSSYEEQYDFGQKGFIGLIDITTMLNNMDKLITIETYNKN